MAYGESLQLIIHHVCLLAKTGAFECIMFQCQFQYFCSAIFVNVIPIIYIYCKKICESTKESICWCSVLVVLQVNMMPTQYSALISNHPRFLMDTTKEGNLLEKRKSLGDKFKLGKFKLMSDVFAYSNISLEEFYWVHYIFLRFHMSYFQLTVSCMGLRKKYILIGLIPFVLHLACVDTC